MNDDSKPIVTQDPETFAVYVRLQESEHCETTVEWYPDRVFADFDTDGNLIGVEII